MKKQLFYSMLLAGALAGFTSCSSDVDDQGKDITNGGDDGQEVSYLTVNIVSNSSEDAGTRAAGTEETKGDGTFEDGETDESLIQNARFYFFNSDGSAYSLAHPATELSATANFIDVNFGSSTVNDPDQRNSGASDYTVENRSSTTLLIEGAPSQEAKPSLMVTIVNYGNLSTGVLDNTSKSLSDLQNLNKTSSFMTSTGKEFVMSSSVYAPLSGGDAVIATSIIGNVMDSKDAALASPIDIFVERIAAKVKVSASNATSTSEPTSSEKWGQMTIGSDTYKAYFLGDSYKYLDPTTGTEKNFSAIAVIKGWTLADANSSARVIKNLAESSTWYSYLDGGDDQSTNTNPSPAWTAPQYRRSYWEVTKDEYKRATSPTWNQTTGTLGNVTYTMPNTPYERHNFNFFTGRTSVDLSHHDLTKVLVAAQIYTKKEDDSDYSAESLIKYNSFYFLGEETVKSYIASQYSSYYTDQDNTKSITKDDIVFGTPTSTGQSTDYQLSITLDPSKTYYKSDGAGSYTTLNDDEMKLDTYGASVMMANNGDAYYYTTIKHLWGANNDASTAINKMGYFGVVRNHYYKVDITGMTGFGTPVPNPDNPIIPITPSESESYLAARINVLMWRVVSQNVNLGEN